MDKPHCLDVRMFDQRMVGIEMCKVLPLMSKPSYFEFAVLELSNPLMLGYSYSVLPLTQIQLNYRFTYFCMGTI